MRGLPFPHLIPRSTPRHPTLGNVVLLIHFQSHFIAWPQSRVDEVFASATPFLSHSHLSQRCCRGLRGFLLPLGEGEQAPLCHQMRGGRGRRPRLSSGPVRSAEDRSFLPVRPRPQPAEPVTRPRSAGPAPWPPGHPPASTCVVQGH